MKKFRQFIKEALNQTDHHALAFHQAVRTHLEKNKDNFGNMIKAGADGRPEIHIPVNALNVPDKVKEKYSGFHTIKLSNKKTKGAFEAGHVDVSRDNKRRFFGILPGKKGHHLSVSTMTHLTKGAVANKDLHGHLHRATLDSWNNSYPIFRHEFEHVDQVVARKQNLKPETERKAYRNSAHEVEADAAVLRHHIDTAYKSHPEHFAHIRPDGSEKSARQVIHATYITGKKIKNDDMTSVRTSYNRLSPENRRIFHDVAHEHMAENHANMSKSHENHRNDRIAAIKKYRRSNGVGGNTIQSSTYPAGGVVGIKRIHKSSGHTPEGVMYEPEEAHRQVENYHRYAFSKWKTHKDEEGTYKTVVPNSVDHVKRQEFYQKHGIKYNPNWNNHKHLISTHLNDYENSPHHVANYLNAMKRHFPHVHKEMGHEDINYDTNKKAAEESQ